MKELLKNYSPASVLVLNLEKNGPTLQLRKNIVFPKMHLLKKSHHNFEQLFVCRM